MSDQEKDAKDSDNLLENQEQPAPEASQEPNLMKKGDYTVHVLIEEIKNLIPKKADFLPKPVVKVTALNKTQRTTKPQTDCDAYTYNEHMYFDFTDLTVETLDSSKVIIEAYDYKNSDKEDYFGVYEFDFEYVYSKKNHSIKNLWIALANPNAKDITRVNGYLKMSISILSTEDEKIELKMDENSDSDCMVPPQIKITYKQLNIFIFKGEEFPDMDVLVGDERKLNRRCNGFIECHYLGIMKKTKVSDMNKEVITWNEMISIPVSQPAVSQKLVFIVKDHNVTKDNIVGCFEIRINDILSGKYSNITYVNLYGAINVGDRSKEASMMNQNAEIGSRWKGRVYLKIDCKDCETPITGVSPIEDKELIDKVNKTSRKFLWSLYVKLYEGYYLPSEKGEYGVRICVQGNEEQFPCVKAVNRTSSWYLCKTFAINTLTKDLDELPDLIIYLTNKKNKQICFQRIKLKAFHLCDDTLMIKLFPEPCMKEVKEMFNSGILKLRIKLFNRELDPQNRLDVSAFRDGDENKKDKEIKGIDSMLEKSESFGNVDDLENLLHQEKKILPKEETIINVTKGEYKYYTVVANIYMTRYLVSGDSNGMSDPYTELTIFGNTKKTSTKHKCVNGIWNEKLYFDSVYFNVEDKSSWPVMLLQVKDEDTVGFDLLGYTYVWLTDSNYEINNSKLIQPKWHQLYLEKSNKAQGQILLSFYILDNENRNLIYDINIEPETEPYTVEINALGLRDLKPLSFIKIKKPFISFDLNSINVSSGGEALEAIKTQPNDAGANPNINTVLKFDVKLPKNEIFMPELQCNVYDHVLGGLINKLLGVFLVSVRQIIKITKEDFEEDYQEAEREEKLLEKSRNERNFNDSLVDGMKEKIDENDIRLNIRSEMEDINEKSNRNLKGENKDELFAPSVIDNKPNISSTFICKNPSDLNELYMGPIDQNKLEQNKYNSDYFAIKPSFTTFNFSKKTNKKRKEENINNENDENIYNNNDNNDNQQENNNTAAHLESIDSVKSTKEVSHLIEDTNQTPTEDLYFPIGFNKNSNPLKYTANDGLLISKITGSVINAEENKQKQNNNEDVSNNKKHYRRIIGKELEACKELDLGAPFIKCHLVRNKYEDSESNIIDLFDAMKDDSTKIVKRYKDQDEKVKQKLQGKNYNKALLQYIETEQENMKNMGISFDLKDYGYFKGLIRISTKHDFEKHENFLKNIKKKYNNLLPKNLKFLTAFEDISKNILVKHSVIIRLYILEMSNLPSKDAFSESDPYIKIYLGDELIINEQKNYIEDNNNPKWFKYYDIKGELPGKSNLKIQVYDYDPAFSDDFIGETNIDIEDRYFNVNWQNLSNKPIEVRNLYHPDVSHKVGEIKIWLEIFEKDDRLKMEPWNISPMPKSLLQLRLIVFETESMENLDVEDTSDIYVLSYLSADCKHSTDVHYRCQTGQASFNWRNLIPCELPRKNYDLTVQVYDNDILARDDFICGGRLNLHKIISDVNVMDIPLKLSRDYYRNLPEDKQNMKNIEFLDEEEDPEGVKFWLQTEKSGKNGGRVLCSLEIVPDWYAEIYKVGKGRDEPNVNPYLPPPFGRIEFTLNPFKMFNQCIGPKMRGKVCCVCCCLCCVLYLIFVLPYVVYFISGEVINPFNYGKLKRK